jgi:light-regulated signal transduction histidine kinase (bacteriophytochrome)/CheY-like chemotaxis protein/HPt (histidine-containing phosphotransfer) domain-containing protein
MADADPWIPACEREPIHLPGAIQGWGALLVADAASLRVRHASANLQNFIGLAAGDAIGKTLADVIGTAGLQRLMPAATDGVAATSLLPANPGGPALAVAMHSLGGSLYLEMEAAPVPADGGPLSAGWARSGRVVATLRATESLPALFAEAAAALRRATGFDRAIVYRFDTIGHGEVIAEDCAADMEPFLGINYPASDVPRQARALYLRQLVRVIADSEETPVPLIGAAGTPDLSLSALRAVSPIHLEYLRNMGVRATLAVSLVIEGALWGMLVCHHRTANYVPPAARALCELIGQVTALKVTTLREAEVRHAAALQRDRLFDMQHRLAARQEDPAGLADALAEESAELLSLCEAEGAIVRLGGRTASVGTAPRGPGADALLHAVIEHASRATGASLAVFTTDRLRDLLGPERADIGGDHAGAMLLPLPYRPGDAILWLRPERARVVRWGGNPEAAFTIDDTTGIYRPRRSFAVWLQQVSGQSQPWLDGHTEAARGLQSVMDKLLAGYTEAMRVARDAANRAAAAKSEFLATMSHEIRSPMSGLLGVLELLRATSLDADQSRMAGMIHQSASMLLAVLNDVLDFSKIEAGALSIDLTPVGLRTLVGAVAQPFRVSAAQKGLTLDFTIDPAVPDQIRTDPLRLKQILGNLLSNATKFTASGSIGLRVELDTTWPETMLCFRVSDTGIGIDPDVMERLFSPFTQADGSTTRTFGGTGLGLSISRQLAKLLDGTLTVRSEKGVGSEFTLLLPLLDVTEEQAEQAPASAPARPVLPSGRRVLVVDDDATIRWLSQRQLEKLGLMATVADDGETGLRLLQQEPFDLVLTDCHMPRMDGATLARTIRASADPRLGKLPIIGLTADVTEKQRELCLAAGMSELAIKPLTVERLSQLLQRHLPAVDQGRGGGQGASAPASDVPTLRAIPFDDQIFLAIFPPGEPEGAAWLTDFLANAHREAQALAGLIGTQAAAGEIAKAAHRLAGTSFSVGAMLLGEAARALEHAALANERDSFADKQAALLAALDKAEAAIGRFLSAAPAGR